MSFDIGFQVEHSFAITARDIELFQQLSGDLSRVHTDASFARKHGFDDIIVYGGLILAQLSHVLGQMIPGAEGVSVAWSVKYHQPLYVNEKATLTAIVAHYSESTGLLQMNFEVRAGIKKIASGKTQSIIKINVE